MPDKQELIRESIMRDMSEGVMTISFDGVISYLNPAALHILSRTEEELLHKSFGVCFFDDEANDDFTQAILDAVYDRDRTQLVLAEMLDAESYEVDGLAYKTAEGLSKP